MDFFLYLKPYCAQIKAKLGKDSFNRFLQCSYADVCVTYHFGLGVWIRNELLRPEDELYRFFVSAGVTDKDDMSALLITCLYLSEKSSRSQ